MLMKLNDNPPDCGLSMICPRCGNAYVTTGVSVGNQTISVCDLCENEIINFINQRPKR